MNTYLVVWAIHVEDVDGPLEAARQARAAQLEPGSTATVFHCLPIEEGEDNLTGLVLRKEYMVDLSEEGTDG